MTRLPPDDPPFTGRIETLATQSVPERPRISAPPPGAPNVVVVLLDDVGFGAPGTFGGPIPTPALDRVAAEGVHYTQFHTTALCSPTRAALLTGRNHHVAHMGGIAEIAYGFPGYDGIIPKSTATVAEILRGHGYSTAMFGKAHITPMWELSTAGPFDRWPTGIGFDRFYGFLGGEASQWEPALYDQTTPVEPHLGRDDYHLTEDLADKSIEWLQLQKSSAPDKPFFVYFSPGATHSPHQVWPEWIERFRGEFDDGWDALRERIHRRQLDLGIIPAGTLLTPRPETLPAWSDYPDRYKPVAVRLMEVYAAFLAHTDAQVGRLLAAIDDLGERENTLVVYISGDNGASGEGTVHGAWSAPAFQNGAPEDPEWLLAHLDDFGTARCENHYNAAWAWALDAPFQWMKQIASHFGGTRNGLAISWPNGMRARGGQRDQFHHVIDVAATILEAAGIEPPSQVNGIAQQPLDGVSMAYSFDDVSAPSRRTRQYFEILGNRAIYDNGWVACCFHGRVPWVRSQALPFGAAESWELYRLQDDFSQATNLADAYPEELARLQLIFDEEAHRFGVYPLSDATLQRALPHNRPSLIEGVTRFVFSPANVRMPEMATVNLKNTSFELVATLDVTSGDGPVEGVIICQGGSMGGWSLYLDEGRPTYVYNLYGHGLTTIRSHRSLTDGQHRVGLSFAYHGGGVGRGGDVVLLIDDAEVARGSVSATVPFVFSMSGETLDVGVDTCSPVGAYPPRFPCTATIRTVVIELDGTPSGAEADSVATGLDRARYASQ